MAEPDPGVVETAAQRALRIPEILEMVLGHVTLPLRSSGIIEAAQMRQDWLDSDLAARGTNKHWKAILDKKLHRQMLMEDTLENSIFDVTAVPQAYLHLFANLPEPPDSLDTLIGKSKGKALPYTGICIAVCAATLRVLVLDSFLLDAIAAHCAARPYVRFPNLRSISLFFLRDGTAQYHDEIVLAQAKAFLAGLPDLGSLVVGTGAWTLRGNGEYALEHGVVQLLKAIPGLAVESVIMIMVLARLRIVAAEQVTQILAHFPIVNHLELQVWGLLRLSGMLPAALRCVRITCVQNMIPEVLAILANPREMPHLETVPQIFLDDVQDSHIAAGVTTSMVDEAIVGLRKRASLKAVQGDFEEYYKLINSDG